MSEGDGDPLALMRRAVLEEVTAGATEDAGLEALRLAMIIEDVTGEVLPDAALDPVVLTDPARVDELLHGAAESL